MEDSQAGGVQIGGQHVKGTCNLQKPAPAARKGCCMQADLEESQARGWRIGGQHVKTTCNLQKPTLFADSQGCCVQADMEESQAGGVQIGGQHVKGVYEDQMPLDFAAVLALGCVATVGAAARSRPLAEGFQLHELQALPAVDDHDSGFRVWGGN